MSVTAQNMAKKAVRTANSLVNFAVLAAILLLLAFGCYALWDSNQVYNAANAAQYEIYKPTAADEGKSFGELQAINPEVFSWLTVYGTNIDYPVTQGGDNMKYVNTNAEGSYSLSGSIFLDYENSRDFSDFNSILFGHHMEKQAMFGEIGLFSDKDYFNARLYGSLYYNGRITDWSSLPFSIRTLTMRRSSRRAFRGKRGRRIWTACLIKRRSPAILG